MASDVKKAKAEPAPKKEAAPKEKVASTPESAKTADAPKAADAAKTTDTPKAEASEATGGAPKNYSRGEGQKPVTQAYKDNWNAIFAKKPKAKTKKAAKKKPR